jgi:AcrR family transcriptional regulator
MTAKPRLRADAQRSVAKLTAAAVELFSERGLDCPLEEIARRAGVSTGTLYHRFGTREALIDAVVPDVAAARLDAVVRHADEGGDPWDRFVRYVEGIAALMAGDPALGDVVTRRFADTPRLAAVCADSFARGHAFAAAARADGSLRADFSPHDLVLVFEAVAAQAAAVRHAAPDAWRRGLAFTLDGLRAAAARPLPVGPLTAEQAAAAAHRPDQK